MRPLLIAVLASLAFPGAALAQLYKCTVDGKVTYRERPCDSGTEDRLKVQAGRTPAPAGETTRGSIRRNPGATIAPAPAAPQAAAVEASPPAKP